MKKTNKTIDLTKLIGFKIVDGIVIYPNGIPVKTTKSVNKKKYEYEGVIYRNLVEAKSFSLINHVWAHVNAIEYQISDMISHLSILMDSIGGEIINPIGQKFPHHTLVVAGEFTVKHTKTTLHRMELARDHGLLRLGINGINNSLEISPTVSPIHIKVSWLRMRQRDLALALIDYLTPTIKKHGGELAILPILMAMVNNFVIALLETLDEEFKTEYVKQFEEKYNKRISDATIDKFKVYYTEELSPDGDKPGSILTGMPFGKKASFNEVVDKEVIIAMDDKSKKKGDKNKKHTSDGIDVDELDNMINDTIIKVGPDTKVNGDRQVSNKLPRIDDNKEKVHSGRIEYVSKNGKLTNRSANLNITTKESAPVIDGFVNQYNQYCDRFGNILPEGSPIPNGKLTYVHSPEHNPPPRSNQQVAYVEPQGGYIQQQQGGYIQQQQGGYIQQQGGYTQQQGGYTQQQAYKPVAAGGKQPLTMQALRGTAGYSNNARSGGAVSYGNPQGKRYISPQRQAPQLFVDEFGVITDEYGNITDNHGNILQQSPTNRNMGARDKLLQSSRFR